MTKTVSSWRHSKETCHSYGTTVATVRLRTPLAPFALQGTESLAIFAKGIGQPVIFVEASDTAGTEIYEFHGNSAVGCVPDDRGSHWFKSPGGDLGTLLVVLATGTVNRQPWRGVHAVGSGGAPGILRGVSGI